MTTLRQGSEFIVFQQGKPHLLCSVTEVLSPREVRCLVINGGWPFVMDPATGAARWSTPCGDDSGMFVWRTTTAIPGLKGGDYNDVLSHVESLGFVPRERSRARVWLASASSLTTTLYGRFKKACGAFCAIMAGKAIPVEPDHEDFSDDIPF